MQIFPFSNNQTIVPQDLEKFKVELKKITRKKLSVESARTKFYGFCNEDGFLIQPKLKTHNFWRPVIKGTYDVSKSTINIKLDVHYRGFILLGVWLMMVIIPFATSDSEIKSFIIPLICTGILVFWYVGGLIFYSIDLKKTNRAINFLKTMAEEEGVEP